MAPRWLELFTGHYDPVAPAKPTPTRFRDMMAADSKLTESQLLNANNRAPYKPTADVVVGGGGILGLVYAIHLKTMAPHIDIAVFEKSPSPQYKIGESTLSSFTRFLSTDVMGTDYLLRLFGVKDGLDFIWVDEKGSQPIGQDIGNLDVSLQLDRRMSELFFTMWAQKLGIRVYHGVGIDYDVEIPTEGPMTDSTVKEIQLNDVGQSLGTESQESTIAARYVCDASGFGCRLTSKFGEKELFDGWNTDSYWAYFKPLEFTPPADGSADELYDWDYAATKHVCFPEGWGWFIKIISWHKAPLANLMDLLSYFIELAIQKTPMEEMPSTKELAKLFDCPFEFITSIGWSVRDDAPKAPEVDGETDSERKFLAIQKKYPVLDRIMTQRYELLPRYYNNRTYFVRKQLSYRRPVVAGTNWFAVGNAVGFTNPLISPGINSGMISSIKSAEMTVTCLRASEFADKAYSARVHAETRAAYQAFVHDYAMTRLNMLNRFWHESFRDGRFFEATIICFWAIATDDRTYLAHFLSPNDFEWLSGSGSEGFAKFYDEVMPLMRGPCDGVPVDDEVAKQVQTICRRWLDMCVAKTPQPWSSNQRHYNDELVRVPGKKTRTQGFFYLLHCPDCKYWNTPTLPNCQICGRKRDNMMKM